MKIKLNVSDENYEEIEQKLLSAGFEIDDDAPFVLSQKDVFPSFLSAKSPAGDKVKLLVKDIVFIESYGHEVIIHTT
ncbi:MAG: LytTR family transcriptional regulator, partial [Ruminiclostridium sp.]|nr:LytTR family transcriptional regulator [Ruminiclostridium sp.]